MKLHLSKKLKYSMITSILLAFILFWLSYGPYVMILLRSVMPGGPEDGGGGDLPD